MTNTAIAVRQETTPQLTTLTNEQLQYIAGTEFVPQGLRGNLPAILACVATGRALGIADITALKSIHVIDGKATYSAELMVMLVRRAGHSINGEVDEGKATVRGKRADNGDEMQCTWTLAMAERAGLLSKQNWKRYPESMLWARAASQLCRMLFADCFAGATYTTEELGDANTEANGAPYEDPAAGTPFDDDATPFAPVEASAGGPKEGAAAPGTAPFSQAGAVTTEPASPAEQATDDAQEKRLKKLHVLVGTLRDAGHITTEHLYRAVDPDGEATWARDAAGNLRWRDLRDTLTVSEASLLIDRLTRLEASLTAPKP